MNAIEIKNVCKQYKHNMDFNLKDITLALPEGCVMGLILLVCGFGMCLEFSVNSRKRTHFWGFILFLAAYTALVVGSVMLMDFLMYYASYEAAVGISVAALEGSMLLYAVFTAISTYRFQRMDI